MKRINITIPNKLDEWLVEYCKKNKDKKSRVIQRLLKGMMNQVPVNKKDRKLFNDLTIGKALPRKIIKAPQVCKHGIVKGIGHCKRGCFSV